MGDVVSLAKDIAEGKQKVVDVVKSYLDIIESEDSKIDAMLYVD